MKPKQLWLWLAILFVVYAGFTLISLGYPIPGFTFTTLTDRLIRAFISIAMSAGIFYYVSKND